MDPCNSAQDVVLCHLCETLVPPLYFDICHINLCKTCVGGHILDDSKLHIVVSVKHRQSPLVYSKCPEHTSKLCELHCEQCDIPICVQYVFSKKHKAHDVVDILHFSERKNKALQAGLEELGKKNISQISRDSINNSGSEGRFEKQHRTIDNSSQ